MQVVASASAAAGVRGAGGRDLGCRGGWLCWAVVLDKKVEDKAYDCLRVCLALRVVGMGVEALGSGVKLDESWMCGRYTSGQPCLAVSRPLHGDCVVTFCPVSCLLRQAEQQLAVIPHCLCAPAPRDAAAFNRQAQD